MENEAKRTYSRDVTYSLEEVEPGHGICHIKGRGYNAVQYWDSTELNDFAGMEAAERIMFEHEHYRVIGYADGIKVTPDYGLEMDGHVFKDIEAGAKVYPILKNGVPQQASITFQPKEYEDLRAGEAAEVNGREVVGPVRIYRKWKLESISLCSYGVDDTTSVIPVKMSQGDKTMNKRKYQDGCAADEEKKDEQKLTDEPQEGTEAAADLATQIAELTTLVEQLKAENAELTTKLNELQGAAAEEPTAVENSEAEEEKKEKEDEEEEDKKELSRLRADVSNLTDMVKAMYSNQRLGYSPMDSVKREEYSSPMAYLTALENAKLNHKKN